MKTPLALLMAGKPVENDLNSVAMPGTPLALFHLNGDLRDVVSGSLATDADATYSTAIAKFGSGMTGSSGSPYVALASSKAMPALTGDNVTTAFWIYDTSDDVGYSVLTFYNGAGSKAAYISCHRHNGYIVIEASFYDGSDTDYARLTLADTYYPLNAWNYVTVSLSYANQTAHIGINGTVSAAELLPDSSLMYWSETGEWRATLSNGARYIDELAVMHGVYYSSNFTPPTKPWRV